MRSDFRETNLGEVCEVITDGAHLSPKSVDQGLPMASVKDLFDWGIDTKTARLISEEDFNQLVRQGCQPKNDDVLIAKDGNSALDTVCIQRGVADYVLLSSVAILRPNKEVVIPDYLRFYLSAKNVIARYKEFLISGAAIPRVVLKAFRTAPILLPDLTEQKRILAIVQPIQERIDTIRTENQVLESIAQTLFKSWFVNFDPVHAKAGGREPEGLSTEIAALFPSEFEGAELGAIPTGWAISSLGSLAELVNGFAFKGKDWQQDGNRVVKIGNVTPLLVRLDGCSFVSETTVLGLDKFQAKAGEILVGMTGYVGEAGLVPIHDGKVFVNQRVCKLIPKNPAWRSAVFAISRIPEFKKFCESNASGSAQANISGSQILSFPVVLPKNLSILDALDRAVEPLIETIVNNSGLIANLCDLRDELLPRLISGKIRIEEAEETLADVMPSTEKQVA